MTEIETERKRWRWRQADRQADRQCVTTKGTGLDNFPD